jgi:AraC-like DNA-binding protein
VGRDDVVQAVDPVDVRPVDAGLDVVDDALEHGRDTRTLAALGQRVGAGARTLSRLFHDELGTTFYEWRTQLRICHALVLLAEGHDTTRVARACGWANPSSFIAAFTAIVGTTPGRQRRAYMAPGVVLVQYERQ